jgi:hypothetical protein
MDWHDDNISQDVIELLIDMQKQKSMNGMELDNVTPKGVKASMQWFHHYNFTKW